eukprot:1432013-Pyramimonas_sp.AAC.1
MATKFKAIQNSILPPTFQMARGFKAVQVRAGSRKPLLSRFTTEEFSSPPNFFVAEQSTLDIRLFPHWSTGPESRTAFPRRTSAKAAARRVDVEARPSIPVGQFLSTVKVEVNVKVEVKVVVVVKVEVKVEVGQGQGQDQGQGQ